MAFVWLQTFVSSAVWKWFLINDTLFASAIWFVLWGCNWCTWWIDGNQMVWALVAQVRTMNRVPSQFVTTHWLPTHAPPPPPLSSHATHSLGYHIGTTQVTLVRATISALLPTLKVQHTTNHHCHSLLHTHTPAAIQTVSRATESVPKILQKAWCWLAVNGLILDSTPIGYIHWWQLLFVTAWLLRKINTLLTAGYATKQLRWTQTSSIDIATVGLSAMNVRRLDLRALHLLCYLEHTPRPIILKALSAD
jgi:hypothetical protein